MKTIKQITMLGSLPPLRAISSYCLEFVQAMAEFVKIDFLSFKHIYPSFLYPGGDLKKDTSFPAIEHQNITIHRRLTWYNPLSWLREACLTNGDLLHAQWWSLPLFLIYAVICAGYAVRKKPVVLTIHNLKSHEKSAIYDICCKMLFKMADHFIVHTQINRQQLITLFRIPNDRISVIPHGPLDFHRQTRIDKIHARSQLKIPHASKTILFFGSIRSYKGIGTLLDAMADVRSHIPDVKLVIAGKLWENWEPYEKTMRDLTIENNVLTFLDYIASNQVAMFFCAADLVVLPYRHFDSQSGVGATAVSFRKPMVVTDVGGLADLTTHSRQVVPADNPKALAQAIIWCLKDATRLNQLTEEMDHVADQIAWSTIAGHTWNIYEKLNKGLPI